MEPNGKIGFLYIRSKKPQFLFMNDWKTSFKGVSIYAKILEGLCRTKRHKLKKAKSEIISQENGQPQSIFSYSGMRAFQVENEQKQKKIFSDLQISINNTKYPSIISLLNTSFKYRHITIQDGKFTKFFPSKDCQILICQSNYPIYILQTDEQNINFFVIEVDEGFSMSSIEGIFNSMGEQSSFLEEFWLPVFQKSLNYVDEIGFSSTEIISTNYRNCLSSLTRKSKIRTRVIKPPFVFGMINKQLLEILEIPFYSTLVKKQDLI